GLRSSFSASRTRSWKRNAHCGTSGARYPPAPPWRRREVTVTDGPARRGRVHRAPRATLEPMASTTTAAHAPAPDRAARPDDRPRDPRLPARDRRAGRVRSRHRPRRPGRHRPAGRPGRVPGADRRLQRLPYPRLRRTRRRRPHVRMARRLATGTPRPLGHELSHNLRLSIGALGEEEWLAYTANLHTRPLMPDFALRQMRERDRRAIYRFVRSLGQAGEPAP